MCGDGCRWLYVAMGGYVWLYVAMDSYGWLGMAMYNHMSSGQRLLSLRLGAIPAVHAMFSWPSPPSWKFYMHNASQSQCETRLECGNASRAAGNSRGRGRDGESWLLSSQLFSRLYGQIYSTGALNSRARQIPSATMTKRSIVRTFSVRLIFTRSEEGQSTQFLKPNFCKSVPPRRINYYSFLRK